MKCSISRCRNEICIIVVGKPMCELHWKEYCNGGK